MHNQNNYKFLEIEFEKWILENFSNYIQYEEAMNFKINPKDCHKLNAIREDDILNKFVIPFEKFNLEQLKLISFVQNGYFGNKYWQGMRKIPIIFSVDKLDEDIAKAIEMLVWQIKSLGIFCDSQAESFENETLDSFLKEPVEKCWYCGNNNPQTFNIDKKSNVHFCHKPGCPSSNSNPNSHKNGCCFKEWRRIVKSLPQKLDYILTKKRFHNEDERYTALAETFIDFCDERYYKIYRTLKRHKRKYNPYE